jgi:UDP-hydrolysing UDP-N-acetyl-D-glucosamine 2-epimerase
MSAVQPRRVLAVTGSRADYGYLVPLLRLLTADPDFDCRLVVTGTHLAAEFGMTVREIEADGFPIAARIAIVPAADDPAAVAGAMAHALTGCAETFARLRPEIVVLLGYRYEILAAACAAALASIPIAHLHGGEATEGAIDDAFRHAITKLALLHFPAAPLYRDRIVQMGEAPERVHCVGSLALDALAATPLAERAVIERELDLPLGRGLFVVTFHPVTLEPGQSQRQFGELLAVLDALEDAAIVITRPNADAEGRALIAALDGFAAARPDRVRAFASLGQRRYFGLARHATAVIGNSSSGLLEVPWLGVPTIDIGDRQRGRIAPPSVIHVEPDRIAIADAIVRARSVEFRRAIVGQENPYGDGKAAPRIAAVLKQASLDGASLKKTFHRVPVGVAHAA